MSPEEEAALQDWLGNASEFTPFKERRCHTSTLLFECVRLTSPKLVARALEQETEKYFLNTLVPYTPVFQCSALGLALKLLAENAANKTIASRLVAIVESLLKAGCQLNLIAYQKQAPVRGLMDTKDIFEPQTGTALARRAQKALRKAFEELDLDANNHGFLAPWVFGKLMFKYALSSEEEPLDEPLTASHRATENPIKEDHDRLRHAITSQSFDQVIALVERDCGKQTLHTLTRVTGYEKYTAIGLAIRRASTSSTPKAAEETKKIIQYLLSNGSEIDEICYISLKPLEDASSSKLLLEYTPLGFAIALCAKAEANNIEISFQAMISIVRSLSDVYAARKAKQAQCMAQYHDEEKETVRKRFEAEHQDLKRFRQARHDSASPDDTAIPDDAEVIEARLKNWYPTWPSTREEQILAKARARGGLHYVERQTTISARESGGYIQKSTPVIKNALQVVEALPQPKSKIELTKILSGG